MALTTSLISFWELGEASGTRNDSHGTNHLTDHNTVTMTGGAAEFTAANSEYLDIADNASISVGDIDFTCTGWFYLTSSAAVTAYIAGHWNAGTVNQRSWLLNQYTDSIIYLSVSSDGTGASSAAVTGPTLSPNTWYFFVCGYDALNNQAFLQINNGTYNTVAWTLGIKDSSGQFALGAAFVDDAPEQYLNGRMDQVGFWKRLLTDPEKTWLYNAGAGRSYAEIVAESATGETRTIAMSMVG